MRHSLLSVFVFFFKQETAYGVRLSLVGSEMGIRDGRKEGPSFDLAIGLAWLMASEQSSIGYAADYAIIGELALTGKVRRVKGVLPVALSARAEGRRGLLVPPDNAAEAAVVEGLEVIPVKNLREAAGFIAGSVPITPTHVDTQALFEHQANSEHDLAEVKGQETVKRALEIAAAGGHNLMMLNSICLISPTIAPDQSFPQKASTTLQTLKTA